MLEPLYIRPGGGWCFDPGPFGDEALAEVAGWSWCFLAIPSLCFLWIGLASRAIWTLCWIAWCQSRVAFMRVPTSAMSCCWEVAGHGLFGRTLEGPARDFVLWSWREYSRLRAMLIWSKSNDLMPFGLGQSDRDMYSKPQVSWTLVQSMRGSLGCSLSMSLGHGHFPSWRTQQWRRAFYLGAGISLLEGFDHWQECGFGRSPSWYLWHDHPERSLAGWWTWTPWWNSLTVMK